MRERQYDYRNCTSLFGYAASVHVRSGAICQLCGCGRGERPDFDLWRQLTVEHLIGESQGGHLQKIRLAVDARFPNLPPEQREELSARIDAANTITACSFCNSTTSRDRSGRSMTELIMNSDSGPEETYLAIEVYVTSVLERKREDVEWKVASVRAAFEQLIVPDLIKTRGPYAIGEGVAQPSHFEVGRQFQEQVRERLPQIFHEPFDIEIDLPIGTPPKLHPFDIVSRSRSVVCECKAYTWTASGNVPSAKITHLREALGYLNQLPGDVIRILAVQRATHERHRESLGEYFVRLNTTVIGDVVVIEFDNATETLGVARKAAAR